MPTITLDASGVPKSAIVEGAYEFCGLNGFEYERTPEEMTAGLRKLNALMALLEKRGIALGYEFPAYGAGLLQEPSGVPDDAVEPVTALLAQRLAPGLGATLSDDARAILSTALSGLLANYAAAPIAIIPAIIMGGLGVRHIMRRHQATTDTTATTPPPTVTTTTGGTVTPPTVFPPVNSALPLITGTTTKGQTLSCSTGSWSNSPTSFTYQWTRAGFAISAATLATYVLVDADIGATISCVVSALNTSGTTSATAAGVGPVIDIAPVNTLAPVASGTPTVGQTLSVTLGVWSNSPVSYGYQWKRNGIAITAATASTYLLATADNGATISCTVTATNSGGSASVTSNGLGPVGSVAQIYDARFGTDTVTAASTGWFTFGLHPGSRRVWLNSLTGSDANDGLSAATAKATVAGAIAVFLGAGFAAADQLMVAQGGTYSELTGNSNLSGKGGVSKTYPTAILSYDPADAANTTKYGRATGSAMPVITFPSLSTGAGQCLFSVAGNDGTTHNIAVQGVELKYAGNDGNGCSAIYVGRHDGISYQNCRFNGINLLFPNNASSFGLSQGINVSKCSGWGVWTTDGNTEGVYFDGIDGLYFQDCVLAHGAWKIGANRDDTNARGGPSALGHNYYYHDTNINSRIDRIVSVDSATDGHNVRGSATTTCLVSIDNPIAGNLTGISAVYSEAPTGSIDTCVDPLAMGGDNINSITPRGYGFRFSNAAAGTSVTNGLMIDNPTYGGVVNYIIQADNSNSGIVSSTVTLDKMTAYNFASQLQVISGSFPMTVTWTNSVLDELASGATNSVWNAGTFPNAKNRSQIYTALGFSSKAAIVNMMLYRPDLPWAQALISVAFPAYNKATTYALVSPPDTTGVTPATIYSTDATAPTLTLPTASSTGSTTATIGATTNEANGWLYWIVSTSATAPSAYQLGQGLSSTGSAATAASRQAVSATGVQSVSVSGLTALTTYYAYLMHQDAAGNRSALVSASSFTTSATSPFRTTGIIPISTSTSSQVVTFPGSAVAGDYMVIFATHAFPVNIPTGWASINQPGAGSNCNGATIGKALTSGDISTGSVTVTFTGSSTGVISYAVFIGGVTGVRTTQAFRGSGGSGGSRTLTTGSSPVTGDIAFYWGSINLSSVSVSINRGTTLQTSTSSSFDGTLNAETLGSSGALSATFTYGGGEFGDYDAIIVIQP